jgi:hypothetical protein
MLFSRIVRSRGACQRCRAPATDTAHIIPRRYSATRCLEGNAWALCRSCHVRTGEWPYDFVKLVNSTIGFEAYWQLRRLAEGGIPTTGKLFWEAEVDRLTARCQELGIDTRVRVPR